MSLKETAKRARDSLGVTRVRNPHSPTEISIGVCGERVTLTFDGPVSHDKAMEVYAALRNSAEAFEGQLDKLRKENSGLHDRIAKMHSDRKADFQKIDRLKQKIIDRDDRLAEARAQLGRLDVALPEYQTQLVAYARRWEKGEVLSESIECELCTKRFFTYDGVGACSNCNPGWTSCEDHLTNPSFWPGHRFVWAEHRGPRGRWVISANNWTIPADDLRALFDAFDQEALKRYDVGEETFSILRKEVGRLREIAHEATQPLVERADAQALRAIELGDKCGELEAELERKRIECDKLRDVLHRSGMSAEELAAKLKKAFA